MAAGQSGHQWSDYQALHTVIIPSHAGPPANYHYQTPAAASQQIISLNVDLQKCCPTMEMF